MENQWGDLPLTLACEEPADGSSPYKGLLKTYWGSSQYTGLWRTGLRVQPIHRLVEKLFWVPAHTQVSNETYLVEKLLGVVPIHNPVENLPGVPASALACAEPAGASNRCTAAGASNRCTGLWRTCWWVLPIHRVSHTHSICRTCLGVQPINRLLLTHSLWRTYW